MPRATCKYPQGASPLAPVHMFIFPFPSQPTGLNRFVLTSFLTFPLLFLLDLVSRGFPDSTKWLVMAGTHPTWILRAGTHQI